MNVLLISDDPEKSTFQQILYLKRRIENLRVERIDLVCFSRRGILLNSKILEREQDREIVLKVLEKVLEVGTYDLIGISLKADNLAKIFSDGSNILDLAKRIRPQSALFVFGAVSVVSGFTKRKELGSLQVFERHGVAKVTHEFKEAVIEEIVKIRKKSLSARNSSQ
jgi:hypothetical protein